MVSLTAIAVASSVAGFLLCAYSSYAQNRIKSDSSFSTVCEAIRSFDCKKPFTSTWAYPLSHAGILPVNSTYDLSIASLGMVYYSLMSTYPLFRERWGMHFTGLAGVISMVSVYLAYVVKVYLGVTCPICIALYVVNFTILGSIASQEVSLRTKTRTL